VKDKVTHSPPKAIFLLTVSVLTTLSYSLTRRPLALFQTFCHQNNHAETVAVFWQVNEGQFEHAVSAGFVFGSTWSRLVSCCAYFVMWPACEWTTKLWELELLVAWPDTLCVAVDPWSMRMDCMVIFARRLQEDQPVTTPW